MKRRLPLLMGVGIFLLTGCASPGVTNMAVEEIPIQVLFSHPHCGAPIQEAQALWIDHPHQLKKHLNKHGGPLPRRSSHWDPAKEGCLWIKMGIRRTGGFGLYLAKPTALVQHGQAVIIVDWRRPPPGAFVTQAITNPCLLLKVPKGGFEKILVQDQHGNIRARIKVPVKG